MGKAALVTVVLVQSLLILCQFNAVSADPADIEYHVWFDNKPSSANGRAQSIPLKANTDQKFYGVMQEAAKKDKKFVFEADEYPFGHYVTSINGVKEDPSKNLYWMLYVLENAPNPEAVPEDKDQSQYGVDLTPVEHTKSYLFWRKEVKWSSSDDN